MFYCNEINCSILQDVQGTVNPVLVNPVLKDLSLLMEDTLLLCQKSL